MKNLVASSVILIMVTGCGGATITQQVAQLEAAFTSSVSLINDARRPCKLQGEDAPGCLIKADTYTKIAPIVHGADNALDKAKDFANTNQTDQAKTWLDVVRSYLGNLDNYLDPIRKVLGV